MLGWILAGLTCDHHGEEGGGAHALTQGQMLLHVYKHTGVAGFTLRGPFKGQPSLRGLLLLQLARPCHLSD